MNDRAAPSGDHLPNPLPALKPLELSTRTIAPADRYEVWRDHFSAVHTVEVERSRRYGFDASGRYWMLGPILFGTYETPARKVSRTKEQVARDDLDHWFLRVLRNGAIRSRSESNSFVLTPGQLAIGSYARTYEEERTADAWVIAIIPRKAIMHLRNLIPEPRVLSGAPADLLAGFLLALGERLPSVTTAELPRVSEVLHGMISTCITANDSSESITPSARDIRARADRIIAMHISSPRLGPDRIAALAGVSRSSLYRAFEARGGVAEHVSRLRLDLVRRDLESSALFEVPIYRLAERRGLYNVAAFNRSFRSYFGSTPSEVRTANRDAIASRLRGAPRSGSHTRFIDLLRDAEG